MPALARPTSPCRPTDAALVAAVAALVVSTVSAGCNPYEEALPAPRCHHRSHCLPGEACERGRCEAPGGATLEVAGPVSSVRALLLAAPRSVVEPARSSHARTVAEAGPATVGDGSVAILRFDAVPVLPLHAVVWDGAQERPCEGTPAIVEPIPRGGGPARLALLTRWQGPCLDPPRPLHHTDHLLFQPHPRGSYRTTEATHQL
ncbi:MAG: hypothetical protein ACODAU_07875 [Myxococcota bacterium]